MFVLSYLPKEINAWNFVAIAVATIVLCLLAGLYSSLQVARLSPLK
jgi:ABC-type lipoprotein release transport system permease subunit